MEEIRFDLGKFESPSLHISYKTISFFLDREKENNLNVMKILIFILNVWKMFLLWLDGENDNMNDKRKLNSVDKILCHASRAFQFAKVLSSIFFLIFKKSEFWVLNQIISSYKFLLKCVFDVLLTDHLEQGGHF